ncbi:MAG: hypothetical protein CMJ50_09695, partial [Planctomycetaceae bacterium]|nr:hypothetical protein [Planctomycetaceae bacterium]
VADEPDRIQIYTQNLRYWQYKGQPVLLLGGSKTDHIFLAEGLKEHLDEIATVGANFVRNTMSQREGVDLKPHKRLPGGKFDLDQWNDDYWKRFANCLQWCHERDIIIQIEVWDRFDFSREHWEISPWRPQNNVTYSGQETGFASAYPIHPWRDRQPFFHTIPGMERYNGAKSDLIRKHQEQFVERMLAESLEYPNVLYCMNNETSTDPRWGQHWMKFIRKRAAQKGVTVYCTDMFDDVWKPKQSTKLRLAFDDPKMYPYLDVSQVNSRTFNEDQWNNIFWIGQQREKHPRPLNHTKIYSDGQFSFGTGTPIDGVERFWRNLIAGSASVRFHRPPAGIGLNDTAKSCIRAARKAESRIPLWEVRTAMNLLSNRETDEAYLAARPGEKYLLYFTDGGSVALDLTRHSRTFDLRWIDVSSGKWGQTAALTGGSKVTIAAPGKAGWVATILQR